MTTPGVHDYQSGMETLAQSMGLNYYPVEFELVPPAFMMEVAVYGLPVRMPHWSFGVRYIYQMVQHRMGHSHIFEVVFPGNPGHAYLADSNSLAVNTLVLAHVLAHADFARHNALFRRAQEQVGYHIVEQAAAHAHYIEDAIEEYGQQRVEQVLDAALALEQHIDDNQPLARSDYTRAQAQHTPPATRFRQRFDDLKHEGSPQESRLEYVREPIPPRPEYDLLWFIATQAPEMEDWERDIFLAVREESFYFHPVFQCQIINEGWASYWHARLLREADFLPADLYLQAMKAHSDVVSPYAGDRQVALALNPYHLGFALWDRLFEDGSLDTARKVMQEEDDTGFIRNHLDWEMAQRLGLFNYEQQGKGRVSVVEEQDIHVLHENILAGKYHFGAPRIHIEHVEDDGTLEMVHEHRTDGRGLDAAHAQKVLEYIQHIWRRPVTLHSVNAMGQDEDIKAGVG